MASICSHKMFIEYFYINNANKITMKNCKMHTLIIT
jgi:hypothetical protein